MSADNQQEDNNNNQVEVQEEEPRTYEITATDHINKSMLGIFYYYYLLLCKLFDLNQTCKIILHILTYNFRVIQISFGEQYNQSSRK